MTVAHAGELQRPFQIGLVRAGIFAMFVLLMSLLGELFVDFGIGAPFSGFWAFSMAAGMLGFFPVAYLSVPLGYGLSVLSKNKTSIPMTRALRLSVFFIYFAAVIAMVFLCDGILMRRHLHLQIDTWFIVVAYLLTSITCAAFNWRKL